MECYICQNKNEGTICRKCRTKFKCLAKNKYGYNQCLTCDTCDTVGFPCYNCAVAFGYELGNGNIHWSVKKNFYYSKYEPMKTEEMLKILKKKKKEKSGYCSVQ